MISYQKMQVCSFDCSSVLPEHECYRVFFGYVRGIHTSLKLFIVKKNSSQIHVSIKRKSVFTLQASHIQKIS